MQRTPAAVVALLVAAVVPASIFATFTPLIRSGHVLARLALAPVFYFFSAMAVIGLGVPTFIALARFELIRWWAALGSGFLLGAVYGLLVFRGSSLRVVAVTGVIGVAAGMIFWLVYSRLTREASFSVSSRRP